MTKKNTINRIVEFDRRCAKAEREFPLPNDVLACTLTPEEALRELKSGNEDYTAAELPCFEVGEFEPEGSKRQQSPIAVVVCCSDSRVPPELVFWQGLGRLFVTRVAGNTVDAAALGSIAYAVTQFKTPLIVVLGHEQCGAVTAAVDFVETGKAYDPILSGIVEPILPAVIAARKARPHDLHEASMRENVGRTVDALYAHFSVMLNDDKGQERLRIVGARYDLNDGTVEFFPTARHTGGSPASA